MAFCFTVLGGEKESSPEPPDLPPVETFIMQPICIDSISAWVPADKSGPNINRGCVARRNCVYSCLLPAGVQHTKTEDCPEAVARLLAEHAWRHHEQNLPLTIFNGWQWEYSYSLCQFESVFYDLDARGGSWESSLEAVLTRTLGTIVGQWVPIPLGARSGAAPRPHALQSRIEISAFNSMRTRDGYPKKRQL
jgi:hypothetical protein